MTAISEMSSTLLLSRAMESKPDKSTEKSAEESKVSPEPKVTEHGTVADSSSMDIGLTSTPIPKIPIPKLQSRSWANIMSMHNPARSLYPSLQPFAYLPDGRIICPMPRPGLVSGVQFPYLATMPMKDPPQYHSVINGKVETPNASTQKTPTKVPTLHGLLTKAMPPLMPRLTHQPKVHPITIAKNELKSSKEETLTDIAQSVDSKEPKIGASESGSGSDSSPSDSSRTPSAIVRRNIREEMPTLVRRILVTPIGNEEMTKSVDKTTNVGLAV